MFSSNIFPSFLPPPTLLVFCLFRIKLKEFFLPKFHRQKIHCKICIINISEAKAEIEGPTLKYLTPGSTLKLVCKVLQSTEASSYIFWYKDQRMINYDFDRGINVSSESGNSVSLSRIMMANFHEILSSFRRLSLL